MQTAAQRALEYRASSQPPSWQVPKHTLALYSKLVKSKVQVYRELQEAHRFDQDIDQTMRPVALYLEIPEHFRGSGWVCFLAVFYL